MKKSFLKWFTDQLPIKYIAGIIKDAHYWQKHSLVDFLETQPKEKKYFTHLKRISLLIAILHIPKHTRSLSGSLLGYKTIP